VLLAACGGDDGIHHVDVSCANSTVYLDRFGGAYMHGIADDATQNQSVAIDVARTLPAFPGDDVAWGDLTACIRTALAPFDVAVTETDPGLAQHLELVFTDAYWGDGQSDRARVGVDNASPKMKPRHPPPRLHWVLVGC